MKQIGHNKTSMFIGSIGEFQRLFGEVQAKSLWVEFRLSEFRVLFENLIILETSISLDECSEFHISYDSFLLCQGKAVELSNRITALKSACKYFDLVEIEIGGKSITTAPSTADGGELEGLDSNVEDSLISDEIQSFFSRHLDTGSMKLDLDKKKLVNDLKTAYEVRM